MTIREFARLCGCNPQTLRYYDRLELLKPVRVDRWSGYRFYDKEQARAFVKIKNFQSAGFAISEIKALLEADDEAVRAAFDAKIAEQEERLAQMRRLRQSYQTEMRQMEETLSAIREHVHKTMEGYDAGEEFGLDREGYRRVTEAVADKLTTIVPSGAEVGWRDFSESGDEPDEEEDDDGEWLNMVEGDEYARIYERHGWNRVKEFLEEFIPLVEQGGEYAANVELAQRKGDNMAFCNTLLGILLERTGQQVVNLGVSVTDASDGQNHFYLLKRR